jgi:hypothetical protein
MTATIHDPLARLGTVPSEIQSVYFRAELLRARIAELEGPLLIAAIYQAPDNVNLRNNLMPLANLTLTAEAIERTGFIHLLSILEASDEWAGAREIMEPILEEMAEENRQIEARQKAEGKARQAERDAIEAAKLRAETAADNDPAVIAARKELADLLQSQKAPLTEHQVKNRAAVAKVRRLGEPLVAEAELASDVLDLESDHELLAGDFK